MTNDIETLIFAAFRLLADMSLVKTRNGFVIHDCLMGGSSDPIENPRDVARIVADYIRQDESSTNAARKSWHHGDLLAKLDAVSN